MNKIVLVDGNNLLFRSYYATAYSGNMMKNSKGFPTNALYGFVNMINKIINEESPSYMMVAFDKGKTFRHDAFNEYKGKRIEMPDELREQFPLAKEILEDMGIVHLEIDNYEADDIIGTFSKLINNSNDYEGLIVSSDKDLLQLITDKVKVKLLKSSGYVIMDDKEFMNTYSVLPIRMIDLKAIWGDPSDNIPGVKGIGEKGAIKLISEYGSLENVYANIDKITGSTKDKLIISKDDAFMSKMLATIYSDIDFKMSLEDIRIKDKAYDKLLKMYQELEFSSFIKNIENDKKKIIPKMEEFTYDDIDNINNLLISGDFSFYVDLDDMNYHTAKIRGVAFYNDEICCYVNDITGVDKFYPNNDKYTYDLKKSYVSLMKQGIAIENVSFDMMIAAYLLEFNLKDDPMYLLNQLNIYDAGDDYKRKACLIAKTIYDKKSLFLERISNEEMLHLYNEMELPLTYVLGRMELNGIRVSSEVLNEMRDEFKIKIELLSTRIYNYAGIEFNISSPRQLGEVLFEKLGLPYAKKNKTGYITDASVLEKLQDKHPIIELIMEYRMLTKLFSTYVEGLLKQIGDDGKIHTIYTQTLTRTGRLSSIEPNLQNIPVRYEMGKLIRKAFIPSDDAVLLSSDYSQIELRVFSSMANISDMIDAFNHDFDIHTHTASDIFNVPMELVTKDMRRQAKAVNFGILYGISSYGLATDLKISNKDAKEFIDKYFETYPGIKDYMSLIINDCRDKGYVKTMFNRKRTILEINNKNYLIKSMGERMALNTPIQGTSADILKLAMIKIDKLMIDRKMKSQMLLQVHDELIFDCDKSEVDELTNLVRDVMENIVKLNVPLRVDIDTGDNWYQI